MTHSRDDVLAAVAAAFPADEQETIIAALDCYGIDPGENERARVQCAVVELAGGSRDKLHEYVQVAKVDYRDILAWKQPGPIPEAEGTTLQDAARVLMEKRDRK